MSGLLLFVRRPCGEKEAVECEPTGVVSDVLKAVRAEGQSLRFQGQLLLPDTQLCDTGVSSEAVLELEPTHLVWQRAAEQLQISEDRLSLKKVGARNFASGVTDVVKGGRHVVRVLFSEITWSCIGVGPADYDVTAYCSGGINSHRCVFYNSADACYGLDGRRLKPVGVSSKIDSGDVVTLVLDLERGVVSFTLGDDEDPAYETEVPAKEYVVLVLLGGMDGGSARIVPQT
eukprot:TRINITY_DN4440_c0_g1_i4.p1 TRINITY_DN4440_c0_g1~~TRINITY_DN4440_c0_g1_i4.p1  ORF type:complete len:231 (+),score=57.95 TRINITY_DN4440_c0_g1_i4:173-865(+)